MPSRGWTAFRQAPLSDAPRWRHRVLTWLKQPWAPSVLAGVVTAVVAGRGISSLPLRFDEFVSLSAVVTDPRASLVYEGPLVPYYSVLWLWSGGGEWTQDGWLRALSLVAVVATAVVVAQIARRFGGIKAAYVTGLLFALNPGVHFAAQDARPYALGMFLFTFAASELLRAIDENRGWRWVTFSLALLIATIMMPNGLILLVPLLLLYSTAKPNLLRLKVFWLSLAPTVLLVLMGVTVFASAISTMRQSLPTPILSWIPTGVTWIGIGEAESYGAPGSFAAVLLLLSALSAPGRRVLWGALGCVLLVWLLSQWPSSHWMGRTFVSLIPIVTLAAGLGVVRFNRRELSAVLVVSTLMSVPGYTAVRLWDAPADLRLATQIIEREAATTDQIFGYGYLGEGVPYELAAGLTHYATKEPRWEVTREPTREFWLLYGDYPCKELFSQDVLGGMKLRRCAALP